MNTNYGDISKQCFDECTKEVIKFGTDSLPLGRVNCMRKMSSITLVAGLACAAIAALIFLTGNENCTKNLKSKQITVGSVSAKALFATTIAIGCLCGLMGTLGAVDYANDEKCRPNISYGPNTDYDCVRLCNPLALDADPIPLD